MAAPPPQSPEQLATVEVAPELVLLALSGIAESLAGRRRKPMDVLRICASAYFEHTGIEPTPETLTDDDLFTIAALAARLNALAELVEAGHLANRRVAVAGEEPLAIAEAVSSATLIGKKGLPVFQLLDFLAHLDRAERGRRP